MFKRVKPEKVAGIVALSYLVLIPAGGYFLWRQANLINQELSDVWRRIHDADPSGAWVEKGTDNG